MISDLETKGGAAVAASRLAEGLCDLGCRVTRVVKVADGQDHRWTTSTLPAATKMSLLEHVSWKTAAAPRRDRLYTQFVDRSATRALKQLLMRLKPDAINIHNIHYASDIGWSPDFARVCAEQAPTVWTLHDMWSFTGRCAYSYDCRRFETGCNSACPTAGEYPALAPEHIAPAWQERRRILTVAPEIIAVTPSQWLAQQATAGLWAKHRVEVIPYGLPLQDYQPLSRETARQALGIERNSLVVMTAAQIIDERRKGGEILPETLAKISHRPLIVITLGSGSLQVEEEDIRIHALGYVTDTRTKLMAYNAADILIHPAPVDNLPNVVLEAIACGTPVAGFNIGGVPELVRPGVTGWLANEVTPTALAAAADTGIESIRTGTDLRKGCRSIAEAEYALDLQADRYMALVDSLARS